MKGIAAMPRDPRIVAYWIVVAIVAAVVMTGLRPLFIPEMGLFFGTLVAAALAFAIEVGFSQSLRECRTNFSIMHMLLTLLFGAMSIVCDMPYLFRTLNGGQLTVRQFTEQRDTAVRDVVVARERLAAAAEAARDIATISRQKAEREAASGDSCEKATRGQGVRYDFRMADAAEFEQIEKAVTARSQRLDAVVSQLQALPPETGEALRQGLGKLNASLAMAYGIVQDPALAATADRLDARARADGTVRQGRGGEPFRCPDAMIRDRASATAVQLRSLPALQQRAVVADFTDANAVLGALPARIATTIASGIGKPGGLEANDLPGLAASLFLELLLIGATWHLPIERAIGQRLQAAQRALGDAPASDIAAFLGLLSDADPELSRLWSLLNRYRIRFYCLDIVVVGHGADNEQLAQFSRAMSILTAVGWARRFRTLPLPHLAIVCWWRWPEMRKALYREYFRIDIRALDELNLGELLARMRAERSLHAAASDGWAVSHRKEIMTPTIPPA